MKFNKEIFIFLSLFWYILLFDFVMVCIDLWKFVDIRFYWYYIVFIYNGLWLMVVIVILFIKWIFWVVIFIVNSVDFYDDEIYVYDIKVYIY